MGSLTFPSRSGCSARDLSDLVPEQYYRVRAILDTAVKAIRAEEPLDWDLTGIEAGAFDLLANMDSIIELTKGAGDESDVPTFTRRDKATKTESCLFCGCRRAEADLRKVKSEHAETEYVCTDCLKEPETVAWMRAGGFVEDAPQQAIVDAAGDYDEGDQTP